MKTAGRILSYVLVIALSVALTLFFVGGDEKEPSKLDQLESLITERFIGEVDQTAMEDAAADAMIESLGDRWSYYIPADEYQAHQERMANAYVGIGVTITAREDGYFDITKVESGGPAEEAGVLPGDILIAAEGQDAAELGLSGTGDVIRGEENTQVSITIKRDGQEQTLSVTRRTIQVAVAIGRMLENNIGLVRIENFDSRCADETIAAIEELVNAGAQALIFDVRFNPGGYKSELVEVLDYLLPEGPLFRSLSYTGREEVDTSDADCLDMPMAVLVNGDSYSAAEFFAAALSEYGVATVVGEQTCGKGYYQQTYQLNDGSAVGLSVGKYFTPNGVSLAGVGITPDIVVEVDDETALAIYAETLEPEEDPQIQAAVAALSE